MNDLEQWLDDNTEVPGETAFKVIDVAHLILMGAEMAAEGTAAAGVVGLAGGTLGPVLMFVGMGYELFYEADAKAMADVKKRDFIMGYSLGIVSAAVGVSGAFAARKFAMRSTSGGGTTIQNMIAVAGANAWNAGLLMGYKQAAALSPDQKRKLRKKIIMLHQRSLADQGRTFVDPGNDEDRIWMWAGAFVKYGLN